MNYFQLDIFGGAVMVNGNRPARDLPKPKQMLGRIDETISFCPHCGKRLARISLIRATKCQTCGKAFLVLEPDPKENVEATA